LEICEKMTRVVHCKRESYDVLIDRTTPYGNPFIIGKDGTREEVCEKYEDWLIQWLRYGKEIVIRGYSNKWVCQHLDNLRGNILGCWCKPKQCHGDILAKLADLL